MVEGRPTTYTVYPTGYADLVNSDKHMWTVTIEQRTHALDGTDTWAICHIGRCLNHDGEWEYESIPSERADDFLVRCRWTSYREALAAATPIVDTLRLNGCTAQEASDDVAARLSADG
jgi:hypothetical protein